MKAQKWIVLILAAATILSCFSACGSFENSGTMRPYFAEGIIYEDAEFEKSIYLSPSNGKYVSFYVINQGEYSIQISINGENACEIAPGQDDSITMDVTEFLSFKRKYTFRCISTEGATVDIGYKITQHNETA